MTATELYRPPFGFRLIMYISAYVLFILLAATGRTGLEWVAPAIVLITSPIAMAVINRLEGGELLHAIDPRIGSWTFLFGDVIVPPWVAHHAAKAWRGLPEHWFVDQKWFLFSWATGVVAGLVFHFVLDAPGYRAAGAVAQLSSRSKYWHDFVVYPALFGGLLYLLWPLLRAIWVGIAPYQTQLHFWLAIGGVVAWLVLGALDATVHKPKPQNLHPPGERWPTITSTQ